MRFKFRLERMLSLIRLEEIMKRLELSKQIERVRLLKQSHADCENRIREMLEKGPMNWAWREYQVRKIELDRAATELLRGKIIEESGISDRIRGELRELFMKRKALESLREKRFLEFRKSTMRVDQKSLDELTRR